MPTGGGGGGEGIYSTLECLNPDLQPELTAFHV